MATYANEKLGCSFELPDKITVRQQLAFWDRANDVQDSDAVKYWEAGKALISEWKSEHIPDLTAANLDEMYETKQAQTVNWVSNQVVMFIVGLDSLPKNS